MKTIMKAACVAAVALVPSVAAAACDEGEVVIKFSHVTNTDKHPKGIAASLLEKRVNEEMNGKACMQVFPNSTLYKDTKVLEALLNGDVQLAAPSLSRFEKFTKKFRIFDLPFRFTDINAIDRFQNSPEGEELKNSMVRRGLKGLQYWHNGMKQFSANKPLLKPSDAKGLKFRVQPSDVLVAQIEQIGGSAQKMAFSEVYGALQTKVIDGQANTWSNIYGKKFFEVQDGTTETNHGVVDYLVVTSSKWWDGLPDDVRTQLATILKEVTIARNTESAKVNEENKQKIIESGGVVNTLNEAQRLEWINAMKPVWAKFEADIGEDLMNAATRANKM